MKVAAIQHDVVWEDVPANLARLAPRVATAASAGARLVLLAEMFSTGFSMAVDRVAEAPDGPSARFLADQARAHTLWVGGSIPLRVPGEDRARNCFVLASPDGELRHYAKRHPFRHAGEDHHYAPGTKTETVSVEGVRVTAFICYDLRFADLFWPVAERTDLYVVVANWPAARRLHWQVLLQARAIENQAYVVGVNRVGTGDGLDYEGDSRVIDPSGEIASAADSGTEAVLLADVDPRRVAEVRERYPFLLDRAGT